MVLVSVVSAVGIRSSKRCTLRGPHPLLTKPRISNSIEIVGCSRAVLIRIVSATGNGSKFRKLDDLGWGEVCHDLKVLEVPGKHLELFHEKYIHGILESTETFLEEFRS